MMIRFFVFLFLISSTLSANCQNNFKEGNEIDDQISILIKNGQYVAASSLMVNYANKLQDSGDNLTALQYRLENCNLIDNHIKYFQKAGFTTEDYYTNWYITISLEGWTKKKKEGGRHLFSILGKMQKDAPELLPFYASTLAYIIDDYTEPDYCDSIYMIQSALDVIKTQNVTKETVKQYLRINECFIRNRFYNSIDGVSLISHKLEDCNNWFISNKGFVDNLDTILYRNDIVRYYVTLTDALYYYSNSLGAQENNYEKAVEIQEDCISYLKQIEHLNDTIPLKIASLYSECASDFFHMGDIAKAKEYGDFAFKYLFNYIESIDYCRVLSQLALIFFNTNQLKIAASLKKTELLIREKTELPPSASDYAIYMMYNQNDTIGNIVLGEKLEEKYGDDNSSMADIYRYMADAYSKRMHSCLRERDTVVAAHCDSMYNHYISKSKYILNLYNEYLESFQLKADAIGNYYSTISSHQARKGNMRESLFYAEKALEIRKTKSYSDVALKASALHDKRAILKYIPLYYRELENRILTMLPILGSTESDVFLGNGETDIYHMPEWASWNPIDSVSVSIAYNAALLMKGLTLRYNVLTPYYDSSPSIKVGKLKLDRMKDSIYTITDDNARLQALHRYELKERVLLKKINDKLPKICWQDIKKHLNSNDVCIEFVKYTANAYSWSKGAPTSHYVAILLIGSDDHPIFVDLFDEAELLDVYNLQPKSYEIEAGIGLYEKLWGKLEKYIARKKRVFFSPMGLLNLMNIEALTDKDGCTALEKYNLSRVSSTQQLLTSSNVSELKSIVSFGGIDYAKMSENIIDSLNTRGNWNYLKNTLDEVLQVEKSFQEKSINVTTITGNNATEASFKALDGTTSKILHIASHGFYIPIYRRDHIPYYAKSDYTGNMKDELFYSGLIMSGGQSTWTDSTFVVEKNDGILTAYEISKIDFHNVDLVVLSACETGLGDNLFDGIFGLQRAFKKAGAKSILMSLWQIDDKATSEYMGLFYDFLSYGLSKHESYKRTVAEIKKKYNDPYYWASFVLLD